MMLSNYSAVSNRHKQEALKRLHERVEQGEKPADVLKMVSPRDDYYIDKIMKGFVPMSYLLYDRIMGCSIEDKV